MFNFIPVSSCVCVNWIGCCEIWEMASVTKLIFFTLLFFITITQGEKKETKDKIVIHVPYKIHKHHHTHTSYKVITLPTPKKEDTVIYVKEEIQPVIKHVAPIQIHTEVIPVQSKTPESFIPPHQKSAAALLDSLAHQKDQTTAQINDQQQYSTIVEDQKPLESHTGELVPNFPYKPIIIQSPNDIPNFSFKPVVFPSKQFSPKLIINPGIQHPFEGFYSKLAYQPILNFPHSQKFTLKPVFPPKKVFNDNVGQTSNHVYKTMKPEQKKQPYEVKEDSQENDTELVKNQQIISNSVPSVRSTRRGKMYFHRGHKHHRPGHKNIKNVIHSDPDYDYEHVGYLIIDGTSKKVVGKNFKDPINFSR